MLVILEKTAENAPIRDRLETLGIRYQFFQDNRVESLDARSQSNLYLINFIQSANWVSLRVRLAQANRYYVVYGEDMKTEHVVQAMRDGAYEVLDLKDSDERWQEALLKAKVAQKLWLQLYVDKPTVDSNTMDGRSSIIKALCRNIDRLKTTDAAVLVTGESGVGKERVARALHQQGAFVAVNCAAIPRDLLEAELFGALKGAYTGATAERRGLVREADGGTLFLDEIGEMDLSLQPKLLRFLETHTARPLGGNAEYHSNVRIVSATNKDLEKEASEGRFRLDLYYRLAEVTARVPALRERAGDIPELAVRFMQRAGERFGKNFETIETELLTRWQKYHWPGNVRELKHVVEQLVLFYDGPILRSGWWVEPEKLVNSSARRAPASILAHLHEVSGHQASDHTDKPALALNRKQKLSLAKRLLEESGDDYSWVASQLGIHPTTLYRWRIKNQLV